MRRAGLPRVAAALAAFTALAVWLLWPLSAHPRTQLFALAGAPELGADHVLYFDVYLTPWIVTTVGRHLLHDPLHLFDGPMLHPSPLAVAYSEHMLGAAPITVPVLAASDEPILTHQVLFLAAFVLSGVAALELARWLTGSTLAGVVAGVLFAFAPWRFEHLFLVQLQCTFWLPLAVLCGALYAAHGRRLAAAGFGLALLAQLLASYSLAYPALVATVALLAVLAAVGAARRRIAVLAALGVAAAVATALVSLPYLAVQRAGAQPFTMGLDPRRLAATLAIDPADFVRPGSPVFVGLVPGLLTVLGLGWRARGAGPRSARAAALLGGAIALPLLVLGLGPTWRLGASGIRPLAPLWELVPGLHFYRIPYRFTFLASLGLALLAAVAVARLDRAQRARGRAWLGWTIGLGLALAHCLTLPAPVRGAPPIDPAHGARVYDFLRARAAQGDVRPVLEIPADRTPWDAPRAILRSLHHHQPLVNGYSGYRPPGYPLLLDLARQLPNPVALQALASLTDVRWLVVDLDALAPEEREAWERAPGLRRLERDGGVLLLAREAPVPDHRAQYVDPPPRATLLGTPIVRLGRGAAAAVTLASPVWMVTPRLTWFTVRVRNVGEERWPSLVPLRPLRVELEVSWLRAVGGPPMTLGSTVPLPTDLAPGGEVLVDVRVPTPALPGDYIMLARLMQRRVGALRGASGTMARFSVPSDAAPSP